MLKVICTVFDSAAGLYLDPFVAPSVDFAIRSFRQAVNTDGHQFNNFPEDYVLYHVATFSAETGEIVPLAAPVSLGVAVTLLDRPSIVPSAKEA